MICRRGRNDNYEVAPKFDARIISSALVDLKDIIHDARECHIPVVGGSLRTSSISRLLVYYIESSSSRDGCFELKRDGTYPRHSKGCQFLASSVKAKGDQVRLRERLARARKAV